MSTTTDPHVTLAFVVSDLVIGLADNVRDLEQAWRDNSMALWRLQTERPELWQVLVDLATARKKLLQAAGHLTPETGARQHQPPLSSRPIEAFRQMRGEAP